MAQLQASTVAGTLTTTGNVGIGTTNPQARLHIGNNTSTYGPTIFLDGTFESSASVGHSRIYFNDANFGIGAGKWGPGTDDDLYIWSYNGGGRDIRFAFTTDGFQPVTASAWTTKMIIKSEGSVGIGTITPVSYFQVYDNADVWHARIGGGSGELRIGGQTSNGAVIQSYTPAGTVRDLFIQRDGGFVGIGTNASTAPLQINGAGGDTAPSLRIISAASATFNWATDVKYANLTAGETAIHLIGKANSQYNQAYIGYRHVADGSSSNLLTLGMYASDYLVNITGLGNVGIGVTDPSGRLDVQQNTAAGLLARIWNTNTSGTGASALRIANSGNNVDGNRIEFSDTSYYTATISGDRTQGLAFRTSATGGSPTGIPIRLTITPGGNVGIGTTNPTAQLHVSGGDAILRNAFIGEVPLYGANYAQLSHISRAGTGEYSFLSGDAGDTYVNSVDGQPIYFRHNNTNTVIITSDGNVGIGVTNPTYRLQLGTNGGLADSIRIGDYLVALNTRQYIGYARQDTGLFESSGNGDTPSTVLAGVAGIRIVNTSGILLPSQADNSVQLLTHIYNGNSRVALHANFDGNVGIGTVTPIGLLNVYSTGTTFTSPDITNVPVISILNGSNASVNAHAILSLRTGGSSGGDPFVSFDIRNEAGWSFGMDNSDSNKMKLNPAWNSLTTNTKLTITANGSLLLSGSVVPSETAWKGTAVFGQDGFDKVIIGTLISNYTGATIGGHPSALDAWDDLNIVGGNLIFRANETEYMRMNTSGNFGIGTATPLNKLHVQGGSGDDVIARFATSGTGTNDYSEIHIANNANDRLILGSIGSNYTPVDYAGSRYIYNTSGKLYLKSVDELQLFSGGTALANITMTLTRGGNVGIGTTTPSIYTKLHVQDKKILITSTSNNWGQLQVANTSDGESTIAVAAGGSGAVGNDSTYTRQWIHGINPFGVGTSRYSFTTKYRQGTTPALMMEEDAGGNVGLNPYGGNVGVNTISPTANLHVDSGTTGATAYPLRVDASSLDYALYVSASGNVAVGGLVPAAALNHKFTVFSGSVALRGPNEAAYSYRLNDTGGTNRNALYVSSSNYLNVGNIAYAGIELFHTSSFENTYIPTGEYLVNRIYSNIEGNDVLGTPDKWLAVRVGGKNYAIPMYDLAP